jgi:hypothetical protein
MITIKISFDEIDIIDWYDGIIRGIGKTKEKLYLIALKEWDDFKHKSYLFLDLDVDTASRFQTILDKPNSEATIETNWKQLNSIWDDYVRAYQGNIYLSAIEPSEQVELNLEITNDAECLIGITDYDIEKTIIK